MLQQTKTDLEVNTTALSEEQTIDKLKTKLCSNEAFVRIDKNVVVYLK